MTIPRNLSFLAEGVSSTGVLSATYGGTGQSSITTGDLLYGSASNTISKLAIGSTGTILRVVGGVPTWGSDYTGTVTSVAASVPSFLSISGSPITTSGTLAITYSGTALPVANGGSGAVTLTGYLYGNGTSAFTASTTIPTSALSGTISNAQLANSLITIGGTSISLGGSSSAITNDITIHGVSVGIGAGSVTGNIVVGNSALTSNTTGVGHVAIGQQALATVTTSNFCTAIGLQALLNSTAANNNAFGTYAGLNTTTGGYNVFIGSRSGQTNTTGQQNTYLGEASGYSMTGSNNSILGRFGGNDGTVNLTSSSNVIALSDGAGYARMYFNGTNWISPTGGLSLGTTTDPGAGNLSVNNALLIGTNSIINVSYASILFPGATNNGISLQTTYASTGSNYLLFKNSAGTNAGSVYQNNTTAITYASTSDYRLKNIEGPITTSGFFIDSLKPYVGTWKADGSKFVGFLAHEFQEIVPQSVSGKKDDIDSDGNPIYQMMEASSQEVIANIVAELQSLRLRLKQANIT